ncbi:transposase [Marinomonas algarum]|uniref:Transposase n=1 Tax=Marinomonas algarum TaxID=2883105 RepID=A0A9X1LFC1_9GAMM|nr:transposase [Marinomonas algarum]MCB5162838.1 transposase [Marinomonas algarum]
MLKATKVRIYPTTEQADFLNQQFGAVRFAWNKALSLKNHFYRVRHQNLSPLKDLKPLLAVGKKSRKYVWLKQYDAIALQQAVINLDKAFKNFFDPKLATRFPRFKSKHGKQSSYHCTSVAVGENWIKVPKCRPIKAKVHRPIEGRIKSITLTRTATGKYFASILVEDKQEHTATPQEIESSRITGIDIGLTNFAILDSGEKITNPRHLKKSEANLRRKQKALSRAKKGSRSRVKARLLVAKAHECVANARNDFQHKLSKQIIDKNQAVVVETLKVKNMLKNHKLAKNISDAGWSSFFAKLEYKAKRSGCHLIKIDQWYASSKTCHCCGYKVKEMPLSVRKWDCPNCHEKDIDRDINAAINIRAQGVLKMKAEGLSVSAKGGKRKSSVRLAAA